METLVVLTALVCGAIAAPTLQEQGFQEFKPTHDVLENITQRAKKSPSESEFTEFSNSETSSGQTFDFDSFPDTARSLHFKKPLIVKKKVGYHLYRDSDEEKEQASSRETCKERVKVKLCDEKTLPKSSDHMRTTTIEDVGDEVMSKDEMKQSLKMAKDAIANLERDLKKLEQKPGTKISETKHGDVDAQIHKDIDAARQVLEHIHKNFGDMESMSIHTTTAKDAGSLQNVHLTVAKTEEDRMAQWKEAMKNIQRNAEIARNIEDSFKSAGHDVTVNDFQMAQTPNMEDRHKVFHDMQTQNAELTTKGLDKTKECASKLHDAKSTQAENKEKMMDDDMDGFASTIMESNVDVNSGKTVTDDKQVINFNEKPNTGTVIGPLNKSDDQLQQSRSFDNVSDGETKFDTTDLVQNHINTMRKTENVPKEELIMDNTEMSTTNGEAINTNPVSLSNFMKSTELDTMTNTADCMDNNVSKKLNRKTEPGETIRLNKSATDVVNTSLHDKLGNNLPAESQKSSNEFTLQTRDSHDDAMTAETQHVTQEVIKPFDNAKTNHFQGKMGQNDQMLSTSELKKQNQEPFSTNLKPIRTEVNSGLKSADNENIPSQPSTHTFNMRWPSDQMKNNKPTTLDKGSDDFSPDFQNRVPSMNTRFMNGPHMMHSTDTESDFDASSAHAHVHKSHMDRMRGHMTHGKTPDMDSIAQPNFNMNMRDAMGNFGTENNMMRWKPTHESGRTAYGPMTPAASSGAGSSAVGLFPNANVGGCSIPLLLSCSPSVTSGSLAKALPTGYAPPAYRTEDEFTFFPNKREVKKTKEIVDTTVVKMPTNTKQKITLDTKQ